MGNLLTALVGKECFVPRWNVKTMEMVKLHSMNDYHQLSTNRHGILEPLHEEQRENALDCVDALDLILLPGNGHEFASIVTQQSLHFLLRLRNP